MLYSNTDFAYIRRASYVDLWLPLHAELEQQVGCSKLQEYQDFIKKQSKDSSFGSNCLLLWVKQDSAIVLSTHGKKTVTAISPILVSHTNSDMFLNKRPSPEQKKRLACDKEAK